MADAGLTQYRIDAEQSLLGMLLGAPARAENCGVMPSDLCPAYGHPEVLSAIVSVHEETGAADPSLVLDRLIKLNQHTKVGSSDDGRGAPYLHTLIQSIGAGQLGHYVKIIRGATTRRNIWKVGTQLAQQAAEQTDVDTLLDAASDLHAQLSLVVDSPLDGDTPIPNLSTVADFVREPSPEHTWVIPGILERADRWMLVAGEGIGKSVWSRQCCTLLAAGRHPFAPTQVITPRRTLLIDLENPPDLVRRGLRGLVDQVWDQGLDVEDRAWRWNMPSGIDLRSQTGQQLLFRVIEKVRPDLISLGPLYKASLPKPGESFETAAAETARTIDLVRERYGCAWLIEHHVPKGDGQHHRRTDPIGSSYWMRWPEFGRVLRHPTPEERGDGQDNPNVYVLDRFRGDREVRWFPDRLHKGAGRWPWTAEWTNPEEQQRLYEAVDEDRAEAIRADRAEGRGPWVAPAAAVPAEQPQADVTTEEAEADEDQLPYQVPYDWDDPPF